MLKIWLILPDQIKLIFFEFNYHIIAYIELRIHTILVFMSFILIKLIFQIYWV